MRKIVIIIYFVVLISSSLLAQTSEEYFSSIKYLEKTISLNRIIELRIKDKRWSKVKAIDLVMFKLVLNKKLIKRDYIYKYGRISNKTIYPIKINISFSYLNFYETSTGRLYGKGVMNVEFIDQENSINNKSVSVSSDIYFPSGSLDDYSDPHYKNLFYNFMNEVCMQLSDRLVNKIEHYFNSCSIDYKRVLSFGKALIMQNGKKSKEIAVISALQRGCELAWGISLESIATLTDLADYSEVTTTQTQGIIRNYKVLDQYSKITSDGYYCIIVESIIKNPN